MHHEANEPCGCGCGGIPSTPGARFLRGHNGRLQWGKPGPRTVAEDRGYATPCWIWQHGLTDTGYAVTHISPRHRQVRAHRHLWEEVNGPVPDGLVLHHLCEQRACVNPAHVTPVTHTENIRASSRTRLTLEDARAIKRLRGIESASAIAKRFGVTRACVSSILTGRNWRDA